MSKRNRFSKFDNMPFSLWNRKLPSGRSVYYVRFKNEDGSYQTPHSTEQTSREAAIRWSLNLINEGGVLTKRNVKFTEYADDFFNWDGPYVTFRRQRGRQIGKTHCRHMNSYLHNHLIPYFDTKKLSSLTSQDIKNWQDYMLNETELSPRTINHMLICLRLVFSEALKHHYIASNPCQGVSKLKEDLRERGILGVEETISLFQDSLIWKDMRHYMMCKLSAMTGMRQGELKALQRKYVHDYYIEVVHSWEAGIGLKGPKTKGSKRPVLLTDKLADELHQFMVKSPFNDEADFVFYSGKRGFPITNVKGINTSFYRALGKIGISDVERNERHIVFHSLRHFFNTYLRNNGIPDNLIRDFLGHTSVAMTDNYTHRVLDDFRSIGDLQSRLMIP